MSDFGHSLCLQRCKTGVLFGFGFGHISDVVILSQALIFMVTSEMIIQ